MALFTDEAEEAKRLALFYVNHRFNQLVTGTLRGDRDGWDELGMKPLEWHALRFHFDHGGLDPRERNWWEAFEQALKKRHSFLTSLLTKQFLFRGGCIPRVISGRRQQTS